MSNECMCFEPGKCLAETETRVMSKPRFRFLHEAGGFLHWESVLPVSPGDSRHVHVWMDAGLYLGHARTIHGDMGVGLREGERVS